MSSSVFDYQPVLPREPLVVVFFTLNVAYIAGRLTGSFTPSKG